MFRRMFGGDGKGGQAVSQSAANKTVDAIQKLGEGLVLHNAFQAPSSESTAQRTHLGVWLWQAILSMPCCAQLQREGRLAHQRAAGEQRPKGWGDPGRWSGGGPDDGDDPSRATREPPGR